MITGRRLVTGLTALVPFSLPTVASAHTGVGATHGFFYGFMHPVSGVDHILAMVMVGMFAAQMGGRAVFILPTTFVSLMVAGGVLGIAGIELQFVELVIALSVLVLGGIVASTPKWPILSAVVVVGFFAVFHGFAHGAEMPENAGGLAYGVGFVIATAILHLVGISMSMLTVWMGGEKSSYALRTAGLATAFVGAGLLAGTV